MPHLPCGSLLPPPKRLAACALLLAGCSVQSSHFPLELTATHRFKEVRVLTDQHAPFKIKQMQPCVLKLCSAQLSFLSYPCVVLGWQSERALTTFCFKRSYFLAGCSGLAEAGGVSGCGVVGPSSLTRGLTSVHECRVTATGPPGELPCWFKTDHKRLLQITYDFKLHSFSIFKNPTLR